MGCDDGGATRLVVVVVVVGGGVLVLLAPLPFIPMGVTVRPGGGFTPNWLSLKGSRGGSQESLLRFGGGPVKPEQYREVYLCGQVQPAQRVVLMRPWTASTVQRVVLMWPCTTYRKFVLMQSVQSVLLVQPVALVRLAVFKTANTIRSVSTVRR